MFKLPARSRIRDMQVRLKHAPGVLLGHLNGANYREYLSGEKTFHEVSWDWDDRVFGEPTTMTVTLDIIRCRIEISMRDALDMEMTGFIPVYAHEERNDFADSSLYSFYAIGVTYEEYNDLFDHADFYPLDNYEDRDCVEPLLHQPLWLEEDQEKHHLKWSEGSSSKMLRYEGLSGFVSVPGETEFTSKTLIGGAPTFTGVEPKLVIYDEEAEIPASAWTKIVPSIEDVSDPMRKSVMWHDVRKTAKSLEEQLKEAIIGPVTSTITEPTTLTVEDLEKLMKELKL